MGDRSPTGNPAGPRGRLANDRVSLRNARQLIEEAEIDLELAEQLAGSTAGRLRVEEARRRVELAVRFLGEVTR